jgi:cell fate regulator YaaT (PSP1 superfamily)
MPFIGVEVPYSGKVLYFLTHERDLRGGDLCVFKSQEGWEMGKVKFAVEKEFSGKGGKVRKATPKELEEFKRKEKIAKMAKKAALEKILKYGLPMRLTCTKYPLGKKKIIFYYTAKERVDFRQLVKDLAKVFKVRIQMQQIGVRDEPQILGGIGICGREVCCASFLGKSKDKLDSVALEAARIQNLPLVSSKISGICGRLRCCLNFEYPVYSELIKRFPAPGEELTLQGERVKVVGYNLLKKILIVETAEGVRKTISIDHLEEK